MDLDHLDEAIYDEGNLGFSFPYHQLAKILFGPYSFYEKTITTKNRNLGCKILVALKQSGVG